MRFPNGYGSITHLKGHRRRPYAVRKTIHDKQIYLTFCASYHEALTFLVDYNKDPSIYGTDKMTFEAIYNLEMQEHRKNIAVVTAKNYDIAFSKCIALHQRRLVDITVADLQRVITELSRQGVGHPTQKKVRQVFHNVYKYAVKYQIIPQATDISRFVDIDKPKKKYIKKPFNTRQLNRVKAIADNPHDPLAPWAMTVIMMCYSGPRPSEFLNILLADVKLKKRVYRIRNSKTAAGRNRLVPINKKVLPYYKFWMERSHGCKTLITDDTGQALTYHRFLTLFNKVMDASRCHHSPHECRHTCATWLDDKGANKLSIKRILGHAIQDITDGVYTHKNIRELKKAIDRL